MFDILSLCYSLLHLYPHQTFCVLKMHQSLPRTFSSPQSSLFLWCFLVYKQFSSFMLSYSTSTYYSSASLWIRADDDILSPEAITTVKKTSPCDLLSGHTAPLDVTFFSFSILHSRFMATNVVDAIFTRLQNRYTQHVNVDD